MDVRIQGSGVRFVELKTGWTTPRTSHYVGLAFADFNMAGDGDLLPVLRSEYTGLQPSVGNWVQLRDEDGNSVRAKIMRLDDELIWGQPLWATWVSADSFDGTREHVFATVEPPYQAVRWGAGVGSSGDVLQPA